MEHENTEIADGKKKSGGKKKATGYARTSYDQILWNEFHDEILGKMRIDLAERLEEMFSICEFKERLVKEDYSVLDKKLRSWDDTLQKELYCCLLEEVISQASAISKNIRQEKYCTKQVTENSQKVDRYIFDWEQILQDVEKTIKDGQAEVFYGR